MKKILHLLKDHLRQDFSWPYYSSVALFLGTGLTINYFLNIEFRIDWYNGTFWRMVGYFGLYSIAYYGGFAITCLFHPETRPKATVRFWLLSLFGIFILTVDSGFPYLDDVVRWIITDMRLYSWAYAVTNDSIGFIFVFLPLFLVYPFFPGSKKEAYGLVAPHFDVRPYFMLLLMMMPLIAAASFTEGFINFYPTYKANTVAADLHLPRWLPPAVYETFYGLDFLNVELLFRGFMVVGLSKLLGKDAIIPMVVTYCFIHFGKPVGEAISSIFGGYILGVLALYTRSIWGGVIVHIGIAWSMELAAYLQK